MCPILLKFYELVIFYKILISYIKAKKEVINNEQNAREISDIKVFAFFVPNV